MRVIDARRDLVVLGMPSVLLTAAGFAFCFLESTAAGCALIVLGVSLAGVATFRHQNLGYMLATCVALVAYALFVKQYQAAAAVIVPAFGWFTALPFSLTRHRGLAAGSVAAALGVVAVMVPVVAWWLLKLSALEWGGHQSRVRVLRTDEYVTCLGPALLCSVALLALGLYVLFGSTRPRRR